MVRKGGVFLRKKISNIILIIGILGIVATILRMLLVQPWSSDCVQIDSLILNYILTYFISIFRFYAPITALILFPFSKINRKSLFGLLLSIITLIMILPTLYVNTSGC